MKPEDCVKLAEDVVARSLSGELVLLHLENGTYYGLNHVGAYLWECVEQAPCSLAELTEKLQRQFDIEQAQASADVIALADQLVEEKLWEVCAPVR